MSTYCQGCGVAIDQSAHSSRRRIWCSERCRKSQYSTPCIDCGAPTSGSDGLGAHDRCARCSGIHEGQRQKVHLRSKFAPHRQLVERLWSEGKKCAEIAAVLGLPRFVPSAYRVRGYDLPYRRTPEQVARMRAARWS